MAPICRKITAYDFAISINAYVGKASAANEDVPKDEERSTEKAAAKKEPASKKDNSSEFDSVLHVMRSNRASADLEFPVGVREAGGVASTLGYLPRVLTLALLLYAMLSGALDYKAALKTLSMPERILCSAWIYCPSIYLLYILLTSRKNAIRDAGLLICALLLLTFGDGTYSVNLDYRTKSSDVRVFIWVPMVQIVWTWLLVKVLNKYHNRD